MPGVDLVLLEVEVESHLPQDALLSVRLDLCRAHRRYVRVEDGRGVCTLGLRHMPHHQVALLHDRVNRVHLGREDGWLRNLRHLGARMREERRLLLGWLVGGLPARLSLLLLVCRRDSCFVGQLALRTELQDAHDGLLHLIGI